jgi:hypothetical protein
MFGKLFGKSKPAPTTVDPLIQAKLCGKEVLARLLGAMKDQKGVHVESLLCALGSLAGYACQENLRTQAIKRGMRADSPFQVVTTSDGRRFFFGDPLNQTLVEGKLTVWSLVAGAAQQAGAKSLPDLKELFTRVSATVGSDQFGIPNYPAGHGASDLPINYVKVLWPALFPIVKRIAADPMLWPLAYSFAIQDAIAMAKASLPPEVAVTIVMEAAVPMSKVDLASS